MADVNDYGMKMFRLERYVLNYPDKPNKPDETRWCLMTYDTDAMTIDDLRSLANLVQEAVEMEEYYQEQKKAKREKLKTNSEKSSDEPSGKAGRKTKKPKTES